MNEKTEKALQEMSDFSQKFNEWITENKKKYNAKWESLTDQDQLDYFCAIVERLCKGELDDKGSYRYVLYDVFGWGPESYIPAQCAGYLELHNCIYSGNHEDRLLKEFAKFLGQDENLIDEKVNQFLYKKHA